MVGAVIGVVGFWITLHQISKVKSATEAQKDAISMLKVRFANFDAIQECAQAQLLLKALRDAIFGLNTNELTTIYDSLAICFINLAESNSIDINVTESLRLEATRVGKVTRAIETGINPSNFSIPKHLEIARDFHALLMRVRFQIHQDQ